MSAVQILFGAAAVMFLFTRSGAGVAQGWRWVERFFRSRRQPEGPAFRISRATRFLEQRTPEALSSALAIPEGRDDMLQALDHPLVPARERKEGVGDGHVISTGVEVLHGIGVASG